MHLQFDPDQKYQLHAVDSVVALFQAARARTAVARLRYGMFDAEFDLTAFDLDRAKLLEQVRKVQTANGIPPDAELKLIEEAVEVGAAEKQPVWFPNLSVEMETGTGKTYVYIRTALELARRYGLRKFVIVVPSVAVREGVLKTFKVTERHFAGLFDNEPYRAEVYESKNLNRLRDFTEGQGVRFLVMTVDSFNKDQNVIRQRTDRLQGRVGLHLLQAVRPVLILDEPQNMESKQTKAALASLYPLAALRYSATHKERYNLVYRVTPFDAYRQGLVKRIEVASVVKADDYNQVYLKVVDIRSSAKTVTAKVAVHQRMAGGSIKVKEHTVRPGDCLADKAGREEYRSFVVDEIDAAARTVCFTNGIEVAEGEARGADQEVLFREQVRYTVEQHFRRQRVLAPLGVKVLSLFFIDRVDNYRPADGLVKRLFDEAFDELKGKYPGWDTLRAADVRGAYFATKKRKGGAAEEQDSTTGDNAEDRAAYALIMREKERLLSLTEPVCFLFSHSALREGWDNPNVFQICTLNQTASEVKKRQEVGRGLRLAVDQDGARVFDPKVNVLTVVANESYEDYVAALQREVEAEFGADEAKRLPPPGNARKPAKAVRTSPDFPPEFKALWDQIKWTTRYRVEVDTPKLVAAVLADLDGRVIDPPRVVVTKAAVQAVAGKDAFEPLLVSGAKAVASLAGRFPLPNLVDKVAELLAHVNPPVRLTRRTLLDIVRGVKDQRAVMDNPEEFAQHAADAVRIALEEQIVYGIRYEKDGGYYDMELFDGELTGSDGRRVPATKSLYDGTFAESDFEERYAKHLEGNAGVTFYVKFPRWFRVRTPLGEYNPDWGVVLEERDQFGDAGPTVYLVRETKGYPAIQDVPEDERRKAACGAAHFGEALGVGFKVVTKSDPLL